MLRIADLADGSNLTGVSGVCTKCHRGNNVFLISPDDPTWAKVLTEVTNPGAPLPPESKRRQTTPVVGRVTFQ